MKDLYLAFGKNIIDDMRSLRSPDNPLPVEINGSLYGGNHLTNAAHYFGIKKVGRPLIPRDVVVIYLTDEPDYHFEFYICDALGPENEKPMSKILTNKSLEYLLTATQYGERIIRDRIFVMEESQIGLFISIFTEKGYNVISLTEPEEQSKEPKQLEQAVKDVQ